MVNLAHVRLPAPASRAVPHPLLANLRQVGDFTRGIARASHAVGNFSRAPRGGTFISAVNLAHVCLPALASRAEPHPLLANLRQVGDFTRGIARARHAVENFSPALRAGSDASSARRMRSLSDGSDPVARAASTLAIAARSEMASAGRGATFAPTAETRRVVYSWKGDLK